MGEGFLSAYNGQTTDELLQLATSYRIDSILSAFEQAIMQKGPTLGPNETLNRAEQTVLAIEAMEREVNNGGWSQFFSNCPEWVAILLDSLERIGCTNAQAIASKAVDALGIRGELNETSVQRAIESESYKGKASRLEALTDQYYQNKESIDESLFEFIKTNRKEITLPSLT